MARWIDQDRPVVFFDLETTGTNRTTDRIVEIGLIRIEPDGLEQPFHSLVNPEMPIPAEAAAVHGITDDRVASAPTFRELVGELVPLLDHADFGGFNVARFDIEVLTAEFARAGHELNLEGRRVFDALSIFHEREPRDLGAAHRLYCGTPLEGAHSALADARASLLVLRGQFERYPDLSTDPDELHRVCNRPRLDEIVLVRTGSHSELFG